MKRAQEETNGTVSALKAENEELRKGLERAQAGAGKAAAQDSLVRMFAACLEMTLLTDSTVTQVDDLKKQVAKLTQDLNEKNKTARIQETKVEEGKIALKIQSDSFARGWFSGTLNERS